MEAKYTASLKRAKESANGMLEHEQVKTELAQARAAKREKKIC
jgi:hypothetical protein